MKINLYYSSFAARMANHSTNKPTNQPTTPRTHPAPPSPPLQPPPAWSDRMGGREGTAGGEVLAKLCCVLLLYSGVKNYRKREKNSGKDCYIIHSGNTDSPSSPLLPLSFTQFIPLPFFHVCNYFFAFVSFSIFGVFTSLCISFLSCSFV